MFLEKEDEIKNSLSEKQKNIMKVSKVFQLCILAKKENTNTRTLVSFSPKPVYLLNHNQKCLNIIIPMGYFG